MKRERKKLRERERGVREKIRLDKVEFIERVHREKDIKERERETQGGREI